jgi:acyl-CoA thioester hydrolase
MTVLTPPLLDLFRIPVRIYWEDTDASGVVYHGNYPKMLERARTEWMRSHGIGQRDSAEDFKAYFVVRRMSFDLVRAARLDDLCWATFSIVRLTGTSALVKQELRLESDGTLLVAAEIQVVCLNPATLRPKAIPAVIRALARLETDIPKRAA